MKSEEWKQKLKRFLVKYYEMNVLAQIDDVIAEWKALYEKNNISDGWDIWFPEIGFQNNMIALTESAKDGADFYSII